MRIYVWKAGWIRNCTNCTAQNYLISVANWLADREWQFGNKICDKIMNDWYHIESHWKGPIQYTVTIEFKSARLWCFDVYLSGVIVCHVIVYFVEALATSWEHLATSFLFGASKSTPSLPLQRIVQPETRRHAGSSDVCRHAASHGASNLEATCAQITGVGRVGSKLHFSEVLWAVMLVNRGKSMWIVRPHDRRVDENDWNAFFTANHGRQRCKMINNERLQPFKILQHLPKALFCWQTQTIINNWGRLISFSMQHWIEHIEPVRGRLGRHRCAHWRIRQERRHLVHVMAGCGILRPSI